MHFTTTRTPFCPTFEDRTPPSDATIWRISLSASLAFKLLCDIGHLYPTHAHRPRVGAMLENDGAWTLYCWPRATPDSHLLLLMLGYGAARLADASRWHGQAWLTGDLLGKVLATLATRAYWDMTVADPKLTRDERPGWLLKLPQAGRP
jgi:hypothetical protein